MWKSVHDVQTVRVTGGVGDMKCSSTAANTEEWKRTAKQPVENVSDF